VVTAYPETREIKHRVEQRRLVIGIIGGTGGGILGGTLGYELTATDRQQLSTSTQITLYSIGGALVLTGVIMQVAWHDPAEDLADAYNAALARDLGIAPTSGPVAPPPTSRLFFTPAPMVTADGKTIVPGMTAGGTF
jgi:hypothetical protein